MIPARAWTFSGTNEFASVESSQCKRPGRRHAGHDAIKTRRSPLPVVEVLRRRRLHHLEGRRRAVTARPLRLYAGEARTRNKCRFGSGIPARDLQPRSHFCVCVCETDCLWHTRLFPRGSWSAILITRSLSEAPRNAARNESRSRSALPFFLAKFIAMRFLRFGRGGDNFTV